MAVSVNMAISRRLEIAKITLVVLRVGNVPITSVTPITTCYRHKLARHDKYISESAFKFAVVGSHGRRKVVMEQRRHFGFDAHARIIG